MHRGRSFGAAFWVAILAVLATLTMPVRMVQAQASAPSPAAHVMTMPMVHHAAAKPTPCHEDGGGACARACFFSGQCLAARLEPLSEPLRPIAPAVYARPEARVDGLSPEPGEPPPR